MLSRASIIVGPGRLIRGAGSVHVREPFTLNLQKSTFPVLVQGRGQVSVRSEDLIVAGTFTPDGRWNAATRALLWPHLNPTFGSDPFGAADTPTTIHDTNSHLHTIIASAITQMPSLVLSASQTMIGSTGLTGIRGSGLAYGALASYYTVATSGGTFDDSGFVPSEIKVQNYTGAWSGVSGFSSIQTLAGWTVDFETDIAFIKIEEGGTTRASIQRVAAMAKCTPVGLTAADVLTAYADTARGASVHQGDLTITGADGATIVTLKNAGLVSAGFGFGTDLVRDGELAFVSAATYTSGIPGAIATLA